MPFGSSTYLAILHEYLRYNQDCNQVVPLYQGKLSSCTIIILYIVSYCIYEFIIYELGNKQIT